jgi:hypothetical protein
MACTEIQRDSKFRENEMGAAACMMGEGTGEDTTTVRVCGKERVESQSHFVTGRVSSGNGN